MTFAEHHAAVDGDPLAELKRRLQPWATAPDDRGSALAPEAAIVPKETIAQAVMLLEQLYKINDAAQRAKVRGNA